MFRNIIDASTAARVALFGPSQSGLSKRLVADDTSHESGQTTNRIASESTFATNELHASTVRTRRPRAKLRKRLLESDTTLTDKQHALETFETDPDVVANSEQATVARDYQHSGKAHWLDVRVWRALVVIVAVIVAIADFGFMFSVYRELFVLSVENFQVGQLGEWAVAITLPLLFPAVVIAIAEFAGKSLGRGRARRAHPERAVSIFGSKLAEYEKGWGSWWMALVYAAAASLFGVYFFIMAIHRFGTAASDAGLDFPAWALAVGYGVLPLIALLVDIASRDVVLEHDRKTLKIFARNEKARKRLAHVTLHARSRHLTAWLDLKTRIVRILQDANQSIVLFEQLVTDAYSQNEAIGALAPFADLAGGEGAEVPADAATSLEWVIPALTQHRALSMPIMRWVTNELEADLELLRRLAPAAQKSEDEAKHGVGESTAGIGSSSVPDERPTETTDVRDVEVERPIETHEIIDFPDHHLTAEEAS